MVSHFMKSKKVSLDELEALKASIEDEIKKQKP